MVFRHPLNNYTENGGSAFSWLWCLLLGPIYFAIKGAWGHVFGYIFFVFLTFGLSHLVYPFFAASIVNNAYRRRGWVQA